MIAPTKMEIAIVIAVVMFFMDNSLTDGKGGCP